MSKTIRVSDGIHQLVKENKGGRTMGKVIEDVFGDRFSDKPTSPEKIFFKCDVCKEIEEFNASWDKGYSPEVDKIMMIMGKMIAHEDYGADCKGILKLYNIDMIQQGEKIKREDVLLKVVLLDKKLLIVADIGNWNNPRVGELVEIAHGIHHFKIISLKDLYKIIELLALYYEPGVITEVIKRLMNINFEPDKNKFLTKEIHAHIQHIFNENKFIPEGMFKYMCYLVPSFCYSLSLTTLTDPAGNVSLAPVGNGFFKDIVVRIANRELRHEEALNLYKGIKVS